MQALQHFDFFVIGGGSAGLAAAKEATKYGIKVGLADYVRPTPIGTKWGIGGTCVNVGCIPKKLFHTAGYLGEEFKYLNRAGFQIDTQHKPKHNWATLVQNVTDNIKSSNWKSKVAMKDKNIVYFNKFAQLKSATEVELSTPEGEKEVITSKYILIATGGRPTYPDIPGAQELSITSDDIFWREQNPGKTLVVGASYIALETAGFMQELGIDVTVMVRSIFLRGFDQQLANKVADYMQKIGVKFVRDSVPASIEKATEEGWKTVKYQTTTDGKTTDHEDKFETVLFAIGRSAETKNMGLENVGIQLAKNGKIIVDESDKTAVDSVYALGDVVDGRLELTPPAITSGKLLVHRLFGAATTKLDYRFIPTTIFTPLEYGACGYAEEDAIKEFGKQNVVSYGSKYRPFEWNLDDFAQDECYAKIVVHKTDEKLPNKVVGIHYLGPHAGEVIQGFAIAIKKGVTKEDLDLAVGIHPTSAEEFTLLTAIAGSPDEVKQGCCS